MDSEDPPAAGGNRIQGLLSTTTYTSSKQCPHPAALPKNALRHLDLRGLALREANHDVRQRRLLQHPRRHPVGPSVS